MSLQKLNSYTYWILLVLIGITLIQYWAKFFISLEAGDPWSHQNYWNADVGRNNVLAVLLVATPTYLFLACKNWPFRRANRNRSE